MNITEIKKISIKFKTIEESKIETRNIRIYLF